EYRADSVIQISYNAAYTIIDILEYRGYPVIQISYDCAYTIVDILECRGYPVIQVTDDCTYPIVYITECCAHIIVNRQDNILYAIVDILEYRADLIVQISDGCADPVVYRNEAVHNIVVNALRSEEHTSELQSRFDLVCRLLLEISRTRRSRHSFPTRRSSDLPIVYITECCAHIIVNRQDNILYAIVDILEYRADLIVQISDGCADPVVYRNEAVHNIVVNALDDS